MRKPKVLHIIDHMSLGGAQAVVKGLLESSDKDDTYLYVLRRTRTDIEVAHPNVIVSPTFNKYSLRVVSEVRNFVVKERIDIIHCHLFKSQLVGLIVKILFAGRCKLVFHEHGRIRNQGLLYRAFLKLSYKHVGAFIAVSQEARNLLIKGMGLEGSEVEKVVILHNFLLPKYTEFAKDYQAETKHISVLKVGFAGRLIAIKGWKDFIKVAERLSNDKRFKFYLVGDGEGRKELEEILSAGNLENVEYKGLSSDMGKFYREMDCIVVASYLEQFGLVNIEAQSFGIPLITTMIPGISEVVDYNENCLGFKPGDIDAVIERLNRLYDEPELRVKLAKNGLRNALKYSVENYFPRLNKIYEDLK